MNDYVLKHDFNYGTGNDEEDSIINKLLLRNFQDCYDYVEEIISHSFIANYHDFILIFEEGNVKVFLEKCE